MPPALLAECAAVPYVARMWARRALWAGTVAMAAGLSPAAPRAQDYGDTAAAYPRGWGGYSDYRVNLGAYGRYGGTYGTTLSRYGTRGSSYGFSFYRAGGSGPVAVDTSGAGTINAPHRASWETYLQARARLAQTTQALPTLCTGTFRDPLACRLTTRRWVEPQ